MSRRNRGFRLIILEITAPGERSAAQHYLAPDDGRPLSELRLEELRPAPWIDAAVSLHQIERAAAADRDRS